MENNYDQLRKYFGDPKIASESFFEKMLKFKQSCKNFKVQINRQEMVKKKERQASELKEKEPKVASKLGVKNKSSKELCVGYV